MALDDPRNVGDTGFDGRRATRWINAPGIMDWPYDWTFRSYYCVPSSQIATDIIVAECAQEKNNDYCDGKGNYREYSPG